MMAMLTDLLGMVLADDEGRWLMIVVLRFMVGANGAMMVHKVVALELAYPQIIPYIHRC